MSDTTSGKGKERQVEGPTDQDGASSQQTAQNAAMAAPPEQGVSPPTVDTLMLQDLNQKLVFRRDPLLVNIDPLQTYHASEPLPPTVRYSMTPRSMIPPESKLPPLRPDLPGQGPPLRNAYQPLQQPTLAGNWEPQQSTSRPTDHPGSIPAPVQPTSSQFQFHSDLPTQRWICCICNDAGHPQVVHGRTTKKCFKRHISHCDGEDGRYHTRCKACPNAPPGIGYVDFLSSKTWWESPSCLTD
jgi:hypothetical protein